MTTLPSLRGRTVFVGGPIQHAIGPRAFHEPLRHTLQTVLAAVTAAGAEVFSAHVREEFGATTAQFTPEQVTVRDLDWMRRCDVFVPVLPVLADGTLLRTDGTHVELGWASALGRPIVLVTTPSPTASHLLRGLHTVAAVSTVDITVVDADPAVLLELIEAAAPARVMSR
ncbi:nucleoside 2-deoxyribosyltransferase [Crossiella equi]|uniref:Nucleoside 2-deoxyribosyltransferase n=1 Tax=Crossiella equi TaxID=130796 RepID=A0ABS5A5M9_9PSEU|nr:nucleoside 2-deoxyribosyltransferase [Crossiella equi]MBP2471907.1 nucleoside 2-deoxyribosyltransferase [Crossiella equi]